MSALGITLVINFILLLATYRFYRRSLWLGVFGLTNLSLWIITLYSLSLYPSLDWLRYPFILLVLGVSLMIMLGPISLIMISFYTGIRLLRREGVTPRNLLSLALGGALVFYIFFFPKISSMLQGDTILNYLYLYIGMLILYVLSQSLFYTVSSVMNIINFPQSSLDYIVVLGAGLNGKKVTPLLASRIDKGIKIYRKYKGAKLIMSGGQGEDELISEAEAMMSYAISKGVSKDDIILENRSRNTEENIRFSYNLMPTTAHFALVTNYYHVFRALLWARRQAIPCIGYGAKTKFYFSLNAFIREFVGYLVMSRKKQAATLGALSVLYWGFVIFIYYLKSNHYI